MVFALTYRRPAAVDRRSCLVDSNYPTPTSALNIHSTKSGPVNGIPSALSFDHIVAMGTCPPITLREFLNYMKYVEFSAENLQFYLWYRDYQERWSKMPQKDSALSSSWTLDLIETENAAIEAASNNRKAEKKKSSTHTLLSDVVDDSLSTDDTEVARSWAHSDVLGGRLDTQSEYGSSMGDEKTLLSSSPRHDSSEHSLKTKSSDIIAVSKQPYRNEIARIINTYLIPDSPRELNLSSRERRAVLFALQKTTHPSALRAVAATVEDSLRRQSHPNFIRWSIRNGNRPRIVFAFCLGITLVVGAFIADLLITLSRVGRAWRLLPFLGWFLGVSTLFAASKGMCVVLHGLHHCHVQPWELFDDNFELHEKTSSIERLMATTSNSFEDEPWVARYAKRNTIRKIFDREVWIREPALRQIQDTIFLQSLLCAFVCSVCIVSVFCAFSPANLY